VRLLLIAAVICFAIALLLSLGAFAGDFWPWVVGGLLAWALDALVGGYIPSPAWSRRPAPPQ
jgi:hypothetical protein